MYEKNTTVLVRHTRILAAALADTALATNSNVPVCILALRAAAAELERELRLTGDAVAIREFEQADQAFINGRAIAAQSTDLSTAAAGEA